MKKIKFMMLLSVAIGLGSCSTSTQAVYWVNSSQVESSAGDSKMQCLQVYKGDNLSKAQWEAFCAPIEGFTFEEGYFKKIEVSEKPLKDVSAGAPNIAYTLVREIEKVKDSRFDLQGEWKLVSMGEMVITPEAQPTLKLNISEMKVNGSDSCNTFMGSIETLTNKKLVFGDLASTLMLCAEKMEVADAFGMAMQKVRQYQLKGDQLLLTDKQGGVLLTFAKK
ncbi:META domain-containing protein [Capnocytophaga ochracea]|uniref:DUF4377 domain-containing protein n=1 Tax=Capnocytophaga ochracea TaxID=1018 RepID=UPI002B4714AD|nr:META domain-containing protein [Capnocytophaga ochracea]MEB3015499.1 META domain-containing protein [Capnocytophaga ochracea]